MPMAGMVSLLVALILGVDAHAVSPKPPKDFCQPGSAEEVLESLGGQNPGGKQSRLVTSQAGLKPGRAVQARLLNLTTKPFSYGAEFLIQRYGPTGWSLDENSPDRLWPRRLTKLPPERAGHCYRHTIPSDQSPGRYRFLVWIYEGDQKKPRSAEFRITR